VSSGENRETIDVISCQSFASAFPLHRIIRNGLSILCLLIVVFVIFSARAFADQTPAAQALTSLTHSGMVQVSTNGDVLKEHRSTDAFIPASTVKLVSAWLALSHWGADHQFTTALFYDPVTRLLWVKGSGDPFLVSEEVAVLARHVAAVLPAGIKGVAVDGSLYRSDIVVPGGSSTDNPYDARPSALACNFNTLNLKVLDGVVSSAEAQTPVTPFARAAIDTSKNGSFRINLGGRTEDAERYFAELLGVMLRQNGLDVGDTIEFGPVPQQVLGQPLLRHRNSKTLGEIVSLMLKYSTNFIANQIMLTLVAEVYDQPANFTLVRDYMESQVARRLGWKTFSLYEGAGLSQDNRVSPLQLVHLLNEFEPWWSLLPEVAPGIYAKSGTLTDVSTLAGYAVKEGGRTRFAIMVNQAVPHRFVLDIATQGLVDPTQ